MKKILSCMLLICMVVSLCSLSAFADAPTENNPVVNRASAAASSYTVWGRNYNGTITTYTIPYGTVVGVGYITQGYYVTAVQHRLSTLEWDWNYPGSGFSLYCDIDGQFGTQTYSAVFTYQTLKPSLKSSPADGIVGPKTWSAFESGDLWT